MLTQYGKLQSAQKRWTLCHKRLSSKGLTIAHLGQQKTWQSPFSHCKRASMKGNCPMSCQSAPSIKQLHRLLLCWANLCTHSGDSQLDSHNLTHSVSHTATHDCCPSCLTQLVHNELHYSTSLLSLLSNFACTPQCSHLLRHAFWQQVDPFPEAALSCFKCLSMLCILDEPSSQSSKV